MATEDDGRIDETDAQEVRRNKQKHALLRSFYRCLCTIYFTRYLRNEM